MYPHRMRLRGPWECEPLARAVRRPDGGVEMRSGNLPAPLSMTIPSRWREGGLGDFSGKVRFRRHFGRPRALDAHERVWLTFGGVDDSADVSVNAHWVGRHQGATEPFEFEVTNLLGERNTLQVDVEAPTASGGIWGEVALEVRCPAFLRGVRIWHDGTGDAVDLHATGLVVGTTDGALETCLLLNARVLASQRLPATPAGQPFHLVANRVPVQRSSMKSVETSKLYKARIDLVCGTMIWYGVEQLLAFTRDESGGDKDDGQNS